MNKIPESKAGKIARNAGLDYLRTMAIFIVLANHAFINFFIYTETAAWEGVLAKISLQSVISIEWLFVLSGFLIGTIMIRSFSKSDSWWQCSKDFWMRRWFRTLPSYYLFLLVNVLLVALGIEKGWFTWKFLVFSQNLLRGDVSDNFFGESWSLALDEWFYLLMPIIIGLFFLLKKMENRYCFLLTAGVLIVLPACARFFYPPVLDVWEWDLEIRRVTLYHLDATGWGVLAAIVNNWYKEFWDRYSGLLGFLGAAAMLLGMYFLWILLDPGAWGKGVFSRAVNCVSITLLSVGTAMILPWLTKVSVHVLVDNLLGNFVEKISLYSYTIYLSHMPLLFLIRHVLNIDSRSSMVEIWFCVCLWLLAVYAFSSVVFHRFELPISRVRDRFTRRINSMPL
jgi:peptidoglycan/LPS O-acetylase OafA/YrhL